MLFCTAIVPVDARIYGIFLERRYRRKIKSELASNAYQYFDIAFQHL
jgi:hypothetical protein